MGEIDGMGRQRMDERESGLWGIIKTFQVIELYRIERGILRSHFVISHILFFFHPEILPLSKDAHAKSASGFNVFFFYGSILPVLD